MANDYNVWAWDAATPLNNATADGQINWAEGQDPATVNNSARAMMTATKKWANVNSGNVTVGGSANAITITTGQAISSGHQALGFRVCFKATADNTGATTVDVDGLSPVAIKRPNGDALSAGDIQNGGFHDICFDGTNYKLLVPGAGGSYGTLSGTNTWTGSNLFNGSPTTIGDTAADVVYIKGTAVSSFTSGMFSNSSAAAWRTDLGLGTAATHNTSTSGANVPLMNGANTWSQTQRIDMAVGSNWIFSTRATDKTAAASTWISTYFFDGSGQIAGSITHFSNGASFAGTSQFNTTSDARLKSDRRPIADSGTIIDALNPIYFRWGDGGNEDFGFVAQEIAAIPQVGHTIVKGDDGDPSTPRSPDQPFRPYQMQHGRLEAILVAEIKALRARMAALEAAA